MSDVNPAYAKEHMAFLYEKDGMLHFGCRNPFCGHGDPALPNHWKIPCETRDWSMKLTSHIDGKLTFEVTPKGDLTKSKKVVADDNLPACKEEFDKVFKDL